MGYIAPLTNYQYIQYAERDSGKKYDPFHLVPVNRINSFMAFKECHLDQTLYNHHGSFKRKSNLHQANKINRKRIERAYGEITGKGMHFSEYA